MKPYSKIKNSIKDIQVSTNIFIPTNQLKDLVMKMINERFDDVSLYQNYYIIFKNLLYV